MATTEKKQAARSTGTRSTKAATAKTAPKTTRKKATPKVNLVFQYMGRELSQAGMVDAATNAWVSAGHDAAAIETLEFYVKPEDSAVYYVINGTESGKFDF